jgi:hypothetical protein
MKFNLCQSIAESTNCLQGVHTSSADKSGGGLLSKVSPGKNPIPRLPGFNPKTEIEPRITGISKDYEEVMETIAKPVWCILKSVSSCKSVVKTPTKHT